MHVDGHRPNGWGYAGNLQVALWLVAFIQPFDIQRIRIYSGVGFPDHHLTMFRILYCDEVGGAYFSGYDRHRFHLIPHDAQSKCLCCDELANLLVYLANLLVYPKDWIHLRHLLVYRPVRVAHRPRH